MLVAGLLGSLRQGSYNRALMRAAGELAPEGTVLEVARIDDLPPYDADVDARGLPEPVARLKAALAAADAVLIVSPEYNYSVPGFLKNAIDWASRKPDRPLDGKPGAIMGASTGPFGTVRMQAHLRQIALAVNMKLLGRPEVVVPRAAEKFDAAGALVDARTRDLVREAMAALVDWTRRLREK
jgi:chromate reductase, NAD(P)H dehydrogenase (quinone)